MAPQNEINPEDDLGTDIRVGIIAPAEALYPTLPKLRKELDQCKKDVYNLPFPLMKPSPEGLYPLQEVLLGGGRIGFVNAPLTSSEVRDFFFFYSYVHTMFGSFLPPSLRPLHSPLALILPPATSLTTRQKLCYPYI
jgi:hypothetical protein